MGKKQRAKKAQAFPELASPGADGAPLGTPTPLEAPDKKYKGLQDIEEECLRAQYGDDFKIEEEQRTAWSKTERVYTITIRTRIDSDEEFKAVVRAVLPPSYPLAKPTLTIEFEDGLHKDYQRHMLTMIDQIKTSPIEPEGQAVLGVVNNLEGELRKAAKAKADRRRLPSLEEEAAMAKAEQKRIEDQRRAEEEARLEAEAAKKRELAEAMANKARQQQNDKRRDLQVMQSTPGGSRLAPQSQIYEGHPFEFGETTELKSQDGSSRLFKEVTNAHLIRTGANSRIFTVRPKVNGVSSELLVVKHCKFKGARPGFKAEEDKFETDLDDLGDKIREAVQLSANNPNLMKIYTHDLRSLGEDSSNIAHWDIHILMEYGARGSLEDLIGGAGMLTRERTYEFGHTLCKALAYIHEEGVIHGRLKSSNVLLVKDNNGNITPKISDIGFEAKLHDMMERNNKTDTDVQSTYSPSKWTAPELAHGQNHSMKTDIWDFGVIIAQMSWGLNVTKTFQSPRDIREKEEMHPYLVSFFKKVFETRPQRRSDATELERCELLSNYRNNDLLLNQNQISIAERARRTSTLAIQDHVPRMRTRFENTYEVIRVLGKGAFGEVIHCRHINDQCEYAVKVLKRTHEAGFEEIIKEVRLLAQMKNPYIVQYKDSWEETVEEDDDKSTDDGSDDNMEEGTEEYSDVFESSDESEKTVSRSDFIQFGSVSRSREGSDDLELSSIASNTVDESRSDGDQQATTPKLTSIFYIAMEYCAGNTLKSVIYKEEFQKDPLKISIILRQMLMALDYIHKAGLIHRDLKPDNIFFKKHDEICIGDFGLATKGRKETLKAAATATRMSNGIGTQLYMAPEVLTAAQYTAKVDLYSLGVILFEMCYPPFASQMERSKVITSLRSKKPEFPADFDHKSMGHFLPMIKKLLSHNPQDRPSAEELLKSDSVPSSEMMRLVLEEVAKATDPNSRYYRKYIDQLMEAQRQEADSTITAAWDLANSQSKLHFPGIALMRAAIQKELVEIFKRHGAVDTPRILLFPHTSFYGRDAPVLLHTSRTSLQLRHDLMLPMARAVANAEPMPVNLYSYNFGRTYTQGGGEEFEVVEPTSEAAFDIISDSSCLSLKEAEVLKVLDEVGSVVPCLVTEKMVINLNHSDLLSAIFDFCHVKPEHRKDAVSALADWDVEAWKWTDISAKLRQKQLSPSSISNLEKFLFREMYDVAMKKLESRVKDERILGLMKDSMKHLKEVIDFAQRLGVKTRILVAPLGCAREEFCKGAITFSFQDETNNAIFAVGGRYDSLIKQFAANVPAKNKRLHGVGFNLDIEKLSDAMLNFVNSHFKNAMSGKSEPWLLSKSWLNKRCDVLIWSHSDEILNGEGLNLLRELWDANISAEIADFTGEPLSHRKSDSHHYWHVGMKKSDAVIKTIGFTPMRDGDTHGKTRYRGDIDTVRDITKKHDEVVEEIMSLIRERDGHERSVLAHKQQAQLPKNPNLEVVFLQQHDGKARNKGTSTTGREEPLVQDIVHDFAGRDISVGAIAYSIKKNNDTVLNMIRDTLLSDTEGWNKIRASAMDKKEIDMLLSELKDQLHLYHTDNNKPRVAYIVNTKTQSCIRYDVFF